MSDAQGSGQDANDPDVADDSTGTGDAPMSGDEMQGASASDPPPDVADDSTGTGDTPMAGDENQDATAPDPPPDVADDSTGTGDTPMSGDEMQDATAPDPPPDVADDSSGTGDDPMAGDEMQGATQAGPLPDNPPDDTASGSNVAAIGAAAAAAAGAGMAAGMLASVVSAYIQCLDFPLPPITFSYNPDGWTETRAANWRVGRNPATNGTAPQFGGTQPAHVDVKMQLDAFSIPPPDLMPSEVIEILKALVMPTQTSLRAGWPAAPKVTFGWGANVVLPEAYIASVRVDYQRFLLGVPVRALATVTLNEYPFPAPLSGTNPTSGGLATRRTHTVVDGDTLASISYKEYKDAERWRILAEANGIDDPMRVKVGSVIFVPDPMEAQSWS